MTHVKWRTFDGAFFTLRVTSYKRRKEGWRRKGKKCVKTVMFLSFAHGEPFPFRTFLLSLREKGKGGNKRGPGQPQDSGTRVHWRPRESLTLVITIHLVTIHGRRIEEKARKSENKRIKKGEKWKQERYRHHPGPGRREGNWGRHNTAGKRRNNTCFFVASLCIVWLLSSSLLGHLSGSKQYIRLATHCWTCGER